MPQDALFTDVFQPYTPPARPAGAAQQSSPDDSGIRLNPSGVQRLLSEQPVDVALKVIQAAQFDMGVRGYKKALDSGQDPRPYVAMMFPKSAASIRAMTPAVARPTSALDQARIDEINRKKDLPPKDDVRASAGGLFRIKPDGTVETVVERPPEKTQSPYPGLNFKARQLDAEERALMRKYPGPMALTISPEDKASLADIQKRRRELQLPPAGMGGTPEGESNPGFETGRRAAQRAEDSRAAAPTAPAAAAAPANEVIKIAPNGKRAVFDAATKKFLRYAD